MTFDIIADYFESKKNYKFLNVIFLLISITVLLNIFQLINLPAIITVILYSLFVLFIIGNSLKDSVFKRVGKFEIIDDRFIIKMNDSSEHIEIKDVISIELSSFQLNDYILIFDNGHIVRIEMKKDMLKNFERACENQKIEVIKPRYLKGLKKFNRK